MYDANDRAMALDERDRNSPNRVACRKSPRPIDRIDDQDKVALPPSRCVGRFFRQPAGGR